MVGGLRVAYSDGDLVFYTMLGTIDSQSLQYGASHHKCRDYFCIYAISANCIIFLCEVLWVCVVHGDAKPAVL